MNAPVRCRRLEAGSHAGSAISEPLRNPCDSAQSEGFNAHRELKGYEGELAGGRATLFGRTSRRLAEVAPQKRQPNRTAAEGIRRDRAPRGFMSMTCTVVLRRGTR